MMMIRVGRFIKKGMFVQTRLAYFVLILLVGLILFNFVDQWREKVGEENKIEKCKASVERNAKFKIGKLRFDEDLECPQRGPIDIDGTSKAALKKGKEKIAEEMYVCWRQFGRGQLDLFKSEGVYCKICSSIYIDPQTQIGGLTKYLMENEVPGQDISYYEYLSSFQGGREGFLSPLELEMKKNEILGSGEDGYLHSGQYYVVFNYVKGKDDIRKLVNQMSGPNQKFYAGGALAAGFITALAISAVTTAGISILVVAGSAGLYYLASNAYAFIFQDDLVEWLSFVMLVHEEVLENKLDACKTLL